MDSSARAHLLALDFAHRDFPLLKPSETVREALDKFRSSKIKHKIIYFYVVDDFRHLLGVVPTRLLLTSAVDTLVDPLYLRKSFALQAAATMEDARIAFAKHEFLALPIVDRENRFLGVIDIQSFTGGLDDVLERTKFDEIYELLGVQIETAESASVFRNFRLRIPWLISSVFAGSICAFLVSHYELTLKREIALAFFMSMTLGLNESICMQSATLAIQRLRLKPPTPRVFIRFLFKEFRIALLLGLACSVVVAMLALFWRHDPLAALSIGLSLITTMVVSGGWGFIIPLGLHLLQHDPKISVAPIALGLADLSSLAIYFWIGKKIFGG
jgi:magnesium transporter